MKKLGSIPAHPRQLPPRSVSRLKRRLGCFLTRPNWSDRSATPEADGDWLLRRSARGMPPFLPADKIAPRRKKVGEVCCQSSNHRQDARPSRRGPGDGIFFSPDRAVRGETFMPSGGFSVRTLDHRSRAVRAVSPSRNGSDQMRAKTGDHRRTTSPLPRRKPRAPSSRIAMSPAWCGSHRDGRGLTRQIKAAA